MNDEDKQDFLSTFEPYFKNKSNPIPTNAKTYWINGTSDLVVKQKDGTIKIYDFKSDSRNGMALEEFRKNLKEKYEGQLELYKYAMCKTFGVDKEDIETELIDLYM